MKYDNTTNIIVLGERCVGKSLFIHNYLYNNKNVDNIPPTIGVDYYKKIFYHDNNTYLFKIWDTGNGLLYKNILDFYFKSSSIFIIIVKNKDYKFIKDVFDIIHTDDKINPSNIFILYNKNCNQDNFKFNENELLKYNIKIQNIHFMYINIYNNSEVKLVFDKIKLYVFNEHKNNINNISKNKTLIPLNTNINTKNKNKDSCCFCTIS